MFNRFQESVCSEGIIETAADRVKRSIHCHLDTENYDDDDGDFYVDDDGVTTAAQGGVTILRVIKFYACERSRVVIP